MSTVMIIVTVVFFILATASLVQVVMLLMGNMKALFAYELKNIKPEDNRKFCTIMGLLALFPVFVLPLVGYYSSYLEKICGYLSDLVSERDLLSSLHY